MVSQGTRAGFELAFWLLVLRSPQPFASPPQLFNPQLPPFSTNQPITSTIFQDP
jgi:hypothetical protein